MDNSTILMVPNFHHAFSIFASNISTISSAPTSKEISKGFIYELFLNNMHIAGVYVVSDISMSLSNIKSSCSGLQSPLVPCGPLGHFSAQFGNGGHNG